MRGAVTWIQTQGLNAVADDMAIVSATTQDIDRMEDMIEQLSDEQVSTLLSAELEMQKQASD